MTQKQHSGGCPDSCFLYEDPEFLAAGICGKGIAEKRVKSISKLAIDVDLTDNIIRKYFYQQNAGVFRSCVLCRAGAAPAENGEY